MNETALLEEVKPLLEKMAEGTGKEYCTIQISFRRHSADRFVVEVGAYADEMHWQYAGTVPVACSFFLPAPADVMKARADAAATEAEQARQNYEKQLRVANDLRSKALALQQSAEPPNTLPAIPSDNLPAQLAEVGEK